jgi:ABC-type proline/glycine betaine transport system ATPase subunit
MARRATARDARGMKTRTDRVMARDPRGRYVVHSREGRLGVLRAVLSAPRLLLLDAPQSPDGVLLIPFEAIELINIDARTVLVRPAREALELADERSAGRRDGG